MLPHKKSSDSSSLQQVYYIKKVVKKYYNNLDICNVTDNTNITTTWISVMLLITQILQQPGYP